jgi:plastocyanin
MADKSAAMPVIAGILVGVALIILFSVFSGKSLQMNDAATGNSTTIILMPSSASCGPCLDNFEPQNVTVVIGVNNTVRWSNQDVFPAMIEADNDSDPLFYAVTKGVVVIPIGGSFDFTFNEVGEFDYHGKPWQHGTVTVLR